jgi:tRNA(fMet)-specific endonuclease VapC
LLVLDTDHFSELERGSPAGHRLVQRLNSTEIEKALTVISVEEQMRGWLAEINRRTDPHYQISPYSKFQLQIEAFADWIILPWGGESADLFLNFRRQGVRVGSMDLKIACITIAHGAILLTRNSIDFARVPVLRIENWLD